MNYYCNQTREQKGGEKSQIFRGRERKKKGWTTPLRVCKKHQNDVSKLVFLCFSSLSFFPPHSRQFFSLSVHLKYSKTTTPCPLYSLLDVWLDNRGEAKKMMMKKRVKKSSHDIKLFFLSDTKKAIVERQLNVKALFFSSYLKNNNGECSKWFTVKKA